MMYHGWMWGWGWVGWTLMAVVMVLFWVGLITAIVLAIRYVAGSSNVAAGPPSYRLSRPEDVLAQRFARGEIDDDEYRRRVRTLQEHRSPRDAAGGQRC
jgi:putative membrane protein